MSEANRKELINNIRELGHSFNQGEEDKNLEDFRERYGIEVLKTFKGQGQKLVKKLFGSVEEGAKIHEISLIYALEFEKKFLSAGGIAGGSKNKYPLFFKEEDWNQKEQAQKDEDIKFCEKLIDIIEEIINKVEEIRNKGRFQSEEGYLKLIELIKDKNGKDKIYKIHNIWFLKYLYMIFPKVFVPFYSDNFINEVYDIFGLSQETEMTEPYKKFLRNGIIRLYANELNVSSQLFAQAYYKIKDKSKNNVSKNDNKPEHIEKYEHLNLILYGPPGTGKTYNAKRYAVAICEGKRFSDICDEDYIEIVKRYDSYVEDGLIKFTTFHQSYSYEEFIEGIHPLIDDTTNQISYKVKDGIFKEFCKDTSYEDRIRNQKVLKGNRVFIIDEINRGNISKIFGELITLIEESKRFGKEEALSATLPYTRESFSVPSNIYIIGTMNTADRSIALIDTALRRRFSFIEMMPDYSLLDDINIGEIEISNMLKTINDRIHVLYDREHAIGHSYFLEKELTIEKLGTIFKNKIIPLLQEYFYDDYEKIQMILGDNAKKDEAIKFIRRIPNDNTFFRENIDANSVAEYRYEINDKAFSKEESYLQIYRDLE